MVTWKVLAEYSWSPTTTQSGSFLCTEASSMPIRVVTKEARYIHELSLTLEQSISISSPAVPGLTVGARQLRPTWGSRGEPLCTAPCTLVAHAGLSASCAGAMVL